MGTAKAAGLILWPPATVASANTEPPRESIWTSRHCVGSEPSAHSNIHGRCCSRREEAFDRPVAKNCAYDALVKSRSLIGQSRGKECRTSKSDDPRFGPVERPGRNLSSKSLEAMSIECDQEYEARACKPRIAAFGIELERVIIRCGSVGSESILPPEIWAAAGHRLPPEKLTSRRPHIRSRNRLHTTQRLLQAKIPLVGARQDLLDRRHRMIGRCTADPDRARAEARPIARGERPSTTVFCRRWGKIVRRHQCRPCQGRKIYRTLLLPRSLCQALLRLIR